MRHGVDGRKFGRNTSHRVAMLKNTANAVILNEQIVTTLEKAKEVRRTVDRLITLSKKQDLASRRLVFSRTRNDEVVTKLFAELAKRYENRNGGYTRILKIAEQRRGDGANVAVLQLVDMKAQFRGKQPKEEKAADETKVENTDVSDPFAKIRRLFSSKKTLEAKAATKKVAAEKPVAKKPATKKVAAKKATAKK
jgi:large subunit ribosomal protein L17